MAGPFFAAVLLLIFSFLFPAFALSQGSDNRVERPDEGMVIRAIEVKGLTRIEDEELVGLICLGNGDILHREELSVGIRRAFRKGIFFDIEAVSEPYDGGIRLIYIVTEIPILNKVSVDGNKSFSDRAIKKHFYYKQGEEFKEEYLSVARNSLVEFYGRKGFPYAEIKISVEDAEKAAMVNMHINITEGRPLIIKRLRVSDDVRRLIKLSEGDVFDRDKADRDIERLKNYYKKKDYINPKIGPYWFAEGDLAIPVDPGPVLEVIFEKNKAISARKLRKEVHFIENGDVSDEAIAETVNQIKRLYVSQGYYYARVVATTGMEGGVIKVTFIIYEGKKVILRKISVAGISISSKALKRVLPMVENKPFNNNLLSSSKESLVRFCNALGYLRTEVVEIIKEFHDDGTALNLEFVVNKGPQTKIKSIRISGNKRFKGSEIRELLKLKEDTPYNVIDIGDARHRVLSFYSGHGYLNAGVEVESVIDGEDAALTFKITENRPSIVGKIILRGNQKTKPKIINRELTLEEGRPYNYEELTRSKQHLYKLGIFNKVSIDILEPVTREDDELVRDVLVSLKEGNAGSVEVGVGYGDYEKFRGSVDITYRNLGGYHRQVGFRAEWSAVEERYIFNFKEPWLFNKPNVPLKVFLLKEYTRAINIETRDLLYKIDRTSFIAGVEKELQEGLRAGFDYEYSFVDTKDVEPGVILGKEDTGTIGISSISPSLFYDTRDNPFDPTSGSLQGIIVKYASSLFLSETEFIKGTFQSSWFFPVMKRLVFAFSLRGGAAYGFEETEEIPLIERFFLGGRTTVRGYSNDTLGPKSEDDIPTGGNIFALTNWELRFSLAKGFGLVTFVDGGNVWRTADEVNDDLKYTTGAGLRYSTPVGPIRIDYGHKLDREPGESSGELHFSFGHAF